MARRSEEIEKREKYVRAFNSTMVRIWKERILLLGVIRTGVLYRSLMGLRMSADREYTQIELSQIFAEYGLYSDAGTGRETAVGNPGDIGRVKKRRKKPWMSPKHYASAMNLRDFMAESIGDQFLGIFGTGITRDYTDRGGLLQGQRLF